jgi:hypothetical protein
MSEAFDRTAPQYRLPSVRMVDVVLATLQAAFQQENLLEGQNPYRFTPADPKNSRVWICDPDARVDGPERDGQRMIITVRRGEYAPQELGMQNVSGGDWQGRKTYMDLADAPIFVDCEAGNKLSSEALASISYNILKMFRRQIMADFDIDSIKMRGISPPTKFGDAPAQPWVTTVTMLVTMREQFTLTELTNTLNIARIVTETSNAANAPLTPIVTALG